MSDIKQHGRCLERWCNKNLDNYVLELQFHKEESFGGKDFSAYWGHRFIEINGEFKLTTGIINNALDYVPTGFVYPTGSGHKLIWVHKDKVDVPRKCSNCNGCLELKVEGYEW
jgi:hypothetical protein